MYGSWQSASILKNIYRTSVGRVFICYSDLQILFWLQRVLPRISRMLPNMLGQTQFPLGRLALPDL